MQLHRFSAALSRVPCSTIKCQWVWCQHQADTPSPPYLISTCFWVHTSPLTHTITSLLKEHVCCTMFYPLSGCEVLHTAFYRSYQPIKVVHEIEGKFVSVRDVQVLASFYAWKLLESFLYFSSLLWNGKYMLTQHTLETPILSINDRVAIFDKTKVRIDECSNLNLTLNLPANRWSYVPIGYCHCRISMMDVLFDIYSLSTNTTYMMLSWGFDERSSAQHFYLFFTRKHLDTE